MATDVIASAEQVHWAALSRLSDLLNRKLIFRLASGGSLARAGIRINFDGETGIQSCSFRWNDREKSCRVATYSDQGIQLIHDVHVKNRLIRKAILRLKSASKEIERSPRPQPHETDPIYDWLQWQCPKCQQIFLLHPLVNQELTCPTALPVSISQNWASTTHSA